MSYTPDLSGRSVVWLDQGWQPAYIGYCPTKRAWAKEMRSMGMKNEPWPEGDGHTHTFRNKAGALCIVVSVQPADGRSMSEMVGIIAHEATHVWQYVRGHMGETAPSIEFEAYSVQAITQNLFMAWWQTGGHAANLRS